MLLDVSCVSGKRVEIVLCNADELYGFQIETGKLGEKRIDAMYLGRPDIFLPFPFFSLLFFFIFLLFIFVIRFKPKDFALLIMHCGILK